MGDEGHAGRSGRACGDRGRALIVIAHRGASGYRPEHTLASYALAAEMGADFLEPDLVCTRDGVLICRHDVGLDDTTDGTGEAWDLTLEEIKALRARERLPQLRSTEFDGQFEVPTFAELLELAASLGKGVYPETKRPAEHAERGLALEPLVHEALASFDGPVWMQSFSADSLRALEGFKRVFLVVRDAVDMAEVATFAEAVGPLKHRCDEAFVRDAHAAGLEVHPWTFRREAEFVLDGFADVMAEFEHFAALGVDGLFTDNPDLAVAALS